MMADSRRDECADPADLVAPPAAGRPSRHLTVDACGSPSQRHLWARHTGRPWLPAVARLRAWPQPQLSCPETETGPGVGADSSRAGEGQQRSRSSDGGLVQHRRRRLVLKNINRSWPTSTSVTAPRSVTSSCVSSLWVASTTDSCHKAYWRILTRGQFSRARTGQFAD